MDFLVRVTVSPGSPNKHVDRKNGPIPGLCPVGFHDVVPDDNPSSRGQSPESFLVKVQVLFGTVLVNDG